MNQKKDLRQVKSMYVNYINEQEFHKNKEIQILLDVYRLLKAKILGIKPTENKEG